MKHIYTIVSADAGDGVYRHKFGSKMRSLLVEIAYKFGGIGPKDAGVKIYRANDGQLVWGRALEKRNPRKKRRNSLKSARTIARRMKIYGGKKLRRYGSKIVRKNCGCKKRSRK